MDWRKQQDEFSDETYLAEECMMSEHEHGVNDDGVGVWNPFSEQSALDTECLSESCGWESDSSTSQNKEVKKPSCTEEVRKECQENTCNSSEGKATTSSCSFRQSERNFSSKVKLSNDVSDEKKEDSAFHRDCEHSSGDSERDGFRFKVFHKPDCDNMFEESKEKLNEESSQHTETGIQFGNTANNVLPLREHLVCQICQMELNSLHYLQRISHIKSCLRGASGSFKQLENPNIPRPSTTDTKLQKEESKLDPCTTMEQDCDRKQNDTLSHLSKNDNVDTPDIRGWMKSLELDPYIEVFLKEEIDMTIVHALTDEDLRNLGIKDRLLQRRFLDAAQNYRHQNLLVQRNSPSKNGALFQQHSTYIGHNRKRPCLVMGPANKRRHSHREDLNQAPSKKLTLPSMFMQGSNTDCCLKAKNNVVRQKAELEYQDIWRTRFQDDSLCSAERSTTDDIRNREKCAFIKSYNIMKKLKRRFMPAINFRKSLACIDMRVPSKCSLWTAAARCEQLTDSLEIRIKNRQKQQDYDLSQEKLSRGGVKYNRIDESRAMKVLKLKALEEELAQHEATVAEMRILIANLKKELELIY